MFKKLLLGAVLALGLGLGMVPQQASAATVVKTTGKTAVCVRHGSHVKFQRARYGHRRYRHARGHRHYRAFHVRAGHRC